MITFGNDKIEFYCHPNLYDVIPKPVLASKKIPEWFKRIKPVIEEREPATSAPILRAKNCLPMLDAMCLGYIIPLQADVYVVTNHDCSIIKATPSVKGCPFSTVEKHSFSQVSSDAWPVFKQDPIKFINNWHIKTAPGWSCLIQSPSNHINTDFLCLSGVVDTDVYYGKINFPAIWLKPNFDGYLKAGIPLVQVIPFKRSNFKNRNVIARKINKKEIAEFELVSKKQQTRSGVYTEELREKR